MIRARALLLFFGLFTIVACGKESRDVCLEANPPVAECCADEPTLSYCQPVMDMGMDTEADVPEEDVPPDVVEGCVPACSGDKPHCTADDVCVACLEDAHCEGGVCDEATYVCSPCLEDGDCTEGVCIPGPIIAQNLCKACRTNTECTGTEASKCDATNTCTACAAPADCAHLNLNQCAAGTCVECTTATEATDCNGNVCNGATNTCTTTPIGSVSTLMACVSDSACTAQARCVPLTYNGAPHGNYCMPVWESGQCPRPYGADAQTRTTLAGETVSVCMIREELLTPEAIQQFDTVCTVDAAVCTATGGRCELFNTTTMAKICTYSCAGDRDCFDGGSCGPVGSKYCGAP